MAVLLPRLRVRFLCNVLPINTIISPRPALRFNHPPSTLGHPARPSCPSRFILTVAFLSDVRRRGN